MISLTKSWFSRLFTPPEKLNSKREEEHPKDHTWRLLKLDNLHISEDGPIVKKLKAEVGVAVLAEDGLFHASSVNHHLETKSQNTKLHVTNYSWTPIQEKQ